MKKLFRHILTVLMLLSLFCGTSPAGAKIPPLPLETEAPQWLNAAIRGALEAVWRELRGRKISQRTEAEALALVASRLFPGFQISLREGDQAQRSPRGAYEVFLHPEREWTWETKLLYPEAAERLPQPCADWLKRDIESASGELEKLVAGVPPEALRVCGESFQAAMNALINSLIPGWRCSAHVQAADGSAQLEVRIYPQMPLLLAVAPETLSASVPQLLVDRINKKTLEYLSPLTGLPLDWISFHADELREWLGEKQLDNDLLKVIRAEIDNEITFKPVTKVTTRVESTTLSLRGWMSVHAGSDARFEAGVHLGHYFVLRSANAMRERPAAEIYSELLMKLDNWKADGRFGFRISPVELLWLGLEETTEDDAHLWYRLWIDGPDKKSYGWLRYSEDEDLEMALGYRLTRYFALELYYDDRRDDHVSVRALSNL